MAASHTYLDIQYKMLYDNTIFHKNHIIYTIYSIYYFTYVYFLGLILAGSYSGATGSRLRSPSTGIGVIVPVCCGGLPKANVANGRPLEFTRVSAHRGMARKYKALPKGKGRLKPPLEGAQGLSKAPPDVRKQWGRDLPSSYRVLSHGERRHRLKIGERDSTRPQQLDNSRASPSLQRVVTVPPCKRL